MIKKTLSTLLFLLFFHVLFSQTADFRTIGFFSAVSDSKETNTIILIQDLYYSHISILDGFTVLDYRTTPYTSPLPNTIETPSVAFYVRITESPGKWVCELNAVVYPDMAKYREEFHYDSYYQILLDSKNIISSFFTGMATADLPLYTEEAVDSEEEKRITINLDVFSGTWSGGEFIDKVVILRAGRGFIIYKNGATMNISVEIQDNKLIAKQTSKANASFFPELPRELALTAASQTDPLEWIMTAANENTLVGEKKTIEAVYEDGIPVSVSKITTTAKWTR